jgi:hypothetical protein
MRTALRWTEAEEEFMRAHYGTRSGGDIARQLGRSIQAIRLRAFHMGLTKSLRPAPGPPVIPAVELMADLADARLEADALRVLLAMSRGYITDQEAGETLGLSTDPPPPTRGTPGGNQSHRTSPLLMHAAEQAARGMDIASTRLGSGGVLGVGEGGRFAPGGGRR